ncbi:MAG: hypothetical protein AAGD01_15895 [Acidobacteriota bacterium]
MTSKYRSEAFTVVFALLFITCLVVLVSTSLVPLEEGPVPAVAEEEATTGFGMGRGEWLDLTLALVNIGLVLLTIMVALVGIWGGQLVEGMVRREVKEQLQSAQEQMDRQVKDAEGMHSELRGLLAETRLSSKQVQDLLTARLYNTNALTFGRLARDEGNFREVKRNDLLSRALAFANLSLELFDELMKRGDKGQAEGSSPSTAQGVEKELRVLRLRAVNNLVFYRALQGDSSQAEKTLRLAEELREFGLNDVKGRAGMLLTWVRAVGEFCRDDPEQVKRMQQMLLSIRKNAAITDEMGAELKQYENWVGKLTDAQQDAAT